MNPRGHRRLARLSVIATSALLALGAASAAQGGRTHRGSWGPSEEHALALATALSVAAPGGFIPGGALSFSFTARNASSNSVIATQFAVAVRGPHGQNLDLVCAGGSNITLSPGQTFTCSASAPKGFAANGTYAFWADWRDTGGQWHAGDLGARQTFVLLTPPPPSPQSLAIAGALTASAPAGWQPGQAITFAFQARNSGTTTGTVAMLIVGIRGPHGENVDVPCAGGTDILLTPNQTFTCTAAAPRGFARTGSYTYLADWLDGSGAWHHGALGADQSFQLSVPSPPAPSLALTQSLAIAAPSGWVAGLPVSFSFQVRNAGTSQGSVSRFIVGIRGPGGENLDQTCDSGINVTLSPGQTFACSVNLPRGFTTPGRYAATADWLDGAGNWHHGALGADVLFQLATQPTPTASGALSLVQPIQVITPAGRYRRAPVSFSFQVRNATTIPVAIGRIVVAVRGPHGENRDVTCTNGVNLTLAPGETFTCSATLRHGCAHVGRFVFWADWMDGSGAWHPGQLGSPQAFRIGRGHRSWHRS